MKTKAFGPMIETVSVCLLLITLNALGAKTPTDKATYLGIRVVKVDDTVRDQLKLPSRAGLTVVEVVPDSPAEKAGLKKHDILEKFDDQVLYNPEQLSDLVRGRHSGDEVTLGVIHQGQTQKLEVTLGEHEAPKLPPNAMRVLRRGMPGSAYWWSPWTNGYFRFVPRSTVPVPPPTFQYRPYVNPSGDPFQMWRPAERPTKSGAYLGIELEPVEPSLAAQLDLAEGSGVLVGHVVDGSPAAKAAIKENDVIVKLDHETVKGPADFLRRIQKMKKGQKIDLGILRKGKSIDIEATLGAREPFTAKQPIPLPQYRYVPGVEVVPAPGEPGESVIRFQSPAPPDGFKYAPAFGSVRPEDASVVPHPSKTPPEFLVTEPIKGGALQPAVVVVRSDHDMITLQLAGTNRHVLVQSPDNKTVYDGPFETEGQKAKMPADLRRRLEKITAEIQLKSPASTNIHEMRVHQPEPPVI